MAGYFFGLAAGLQPVNFIIKTVPFATREGRKNILRSKWASISFNSLCV